MDFLQVELKAAQTRIVMLDSDIKDKDQQLSVLWARIKIFEEKQSKEVFNKYFPADDDPTPPCSSSRPPPCSSNTPCSATCRCFSPPCCPAPPSCSHSMHHAPLSCSMHHHHCSLSTNSSSKGSAKELDLNEKIEALIVDIKNIKIALSKLKPTHLFQSQAKDDIATAHCDSVDDDFPARGDSNEDDVAPSPSASTASVEEFIPDFPANPTPPVQLNSLDPTIQLP